MVSEKQIEAAADQISEGLGAFLRKFCDSEASKRARHYLHEMPKDEWNQMALMLATEALTAAEQADPAPAAKPVAWLHEIKEPNGESSILSGSPENPFRHWIEKYREQCTYSATPLYARPSPSKARRPAEQAVTEASGMSGVGWTPITEKNGVMTCSLPADETVVEVMLKDGNVCRAWYSCNLMEAGDWDFVPVAANGEPEDDANSIASEVVAWRHTLQSDESANQTGAYAAREDGAGKPAAGETNAER